MNTHSQTTTGKAFSCSWHLCVCGGVSLSIYAGSMTPRTVGFLQLLGRKPAPATDKWEKQKRENGWGMGVRQKNVCSHQGDSRAKVKIMVQLMAQEHQDSQKWWVIPAFWTLSWFIQRVYMNFPKTYISITRVVSTVHTNNPQTYVEKHLLNNLILKFTFDSLASTSIN